MNIAIVDKYLDTLGGGENYVLTLASCLSQRHEVTLFWPDASIRNRINERYNLDITRVTITDGPRSRPSVIDRVWLAKKFQALIIVSDGSIPFSLVDKTILIFQFPVPGVTGTGIVQKAKLKTIDAFVCYSKFVKAYLDRQLGVNSHVIPPGIEPENFHSGKKKKMIISVGRFTKANNTKKHEVLIDAFKKVCRKGHDSWELVLAGGVLAGDESYVKELMESSRGYPIHIRANISFADLTTLYSQSSIYWHAAGYGENLDKHPERAEHFGITTLEAMTSGCVPVVFEGGGQKELVTDAMDGFLWKTTDELIRYTEQLVTDSNLRITMARRARERPRAFTRARMCGAFTELLEK